MKNIVNAILIASVVSVPVFAESEHHHKAVKRSEPASSQAVVEKKAGHLHKAAFRSAPLSKEQKREVHQHLEEMQALVREIKNEENTEKREKLMTKHMKLMRQCTHVMNHGEGEMPLLNMEEKMIMMEEHMGLMQMMMGQMVEHNSESKKSRIHKHKK